MKRQMLSPLFTWRSAIAESVLPPTSRHVALTLSLHMNERGGSCFPSQVTLAAETGLSRTTVNEHLKTLSASGWIQIGHRRRKTDGRQSSNAYRAAIPANFQPAEDPASKDFDVDWQDPRVLEKDTDLYSSRTGGVPEEDTKRSSLEDVIEDDRVSQLSNSKTEHCEGVAVEVSTATEHPCVNQIADVLAGRAATYLDRPKKKSSKKDHKAIGLLLRRGSPGLESPDPQSPDKVIRLINAVYDWEELSFWRDKIQSGDKLRKHWDSILSQARQAQQTRNDTDRNHQPENHAIPQDGDLVTVR